MTYSNFINDLKIGDRVTIPNKPTFYGNVLVYPYTFIIEYILRVNTFNETRILVKDNDNRSWLIDEINYNLVGKNNVLNDRKNRINNLNESNIS